LGCGRLNGLYAQWFNRRHDRSGHVFGGRFGSIAVADDGWRYGSVLSAIYVGDEAFVRARMPDGPLPEVRASSGSRCGRPSLSSGVAGLASSRHTASTASGYARSALTSASIPPLSAAPLARLEQAQPASDQDAHSPDTAPGE